MLGWHRLWKHFQFAHLKQILCVECTWFLELIHFPNTSIICPRYPHWLSSASMLSNSSLKCCQNMVHSLTGNGLFAHSYKSRKIIWFLNYKKRRNQTNFYSQDYYYETFNKWNTQKRKEKLQFAWFWVACSRISISL